MRSPFSRLGAAESGLHLHDLALNLLDRIGLAVIFCPVRENLALKLMHVNAGAGTRAPATFPNFSRSGPMKRERFPRFSLKQHPVYFYQILFIQFSCFGLQP